MIVQTILWDTYVEIIILNRVGFQINSLKANEHVTEIVCLPLPMHDQILILHLSQNLIPTY